MTEDGGATARQGERESRGNGEKTVSCRALGGTEVLNFHCHRHTQTDTDGHGDDLSPRPPSSPSGMSQSLHISLGGLNLEANFAVTGRRGQSRFGQKPTS